MQVQPEAEMFILWMEGRLGVSIMDMPNDEAEALLAMRGQYEQNQGPRPSSVQVISHE